MNKSSVSIVIPAYNVEKYLAEALDSIMNQVEQPDEVILIDDGSSDETLRIANSYIFPFSYQVISIENGGQGNARNIGANLASSEYLYYFDSDDILDKYFIKTIKEEISNRDFPDIVLFSGNSFNDSEYQGNRWIDYSRGFSGFYHNRVNFLNKAFENRALFCQPCLYISKKHIWGIDRLQFGDYYLEDEAVFYPLLFSCKTYSVLDEVFFYRRNREGSTMTIKPTIKHAAGALNCVETTLQLYHSKSYFERECWHIKKRLGSHVFAYISMSRAAKTRISYRKLFNALFVIRNFKVLIKSLLYMLGVHEIKMVRKAFQSARSFFIANIK